MNYDLSRYWLSATCAAALVFTLTACQPDPPEAQPDTQSLSHTPVVLPPDGRIDPLNWPEQSSNIQRDPAMENAISDLLGRMTLEEKVGQILQADISSVTPADVREYNLGSVLNGGGSAPGNDLRGTPDSWLALADEFWTASTDTSDGGVGIPAIWGTDAVHGHSNIVGATIFPHNIGLGAANDPDLMYEIGRVTALEMLATGLDWTFAPTIAVARNDRWGRTYESYSEDPAIVAAYAPRIVEGLQGRLGTEEFLGENRMIATAKHFVGDGGTFAGIDQGDNQASEAELRDIHAAGYPPAIAAGAQTVMASYNSFHGRKMHGDKEMLTDVLVGRMGFDGFVIGDWNGHGQVRGCSNESCPASFNAGVDMFMVAKDWKAMYHNKLAQLRSGEISMERLDEAVSRILRVKFRAGLFNKPKPSERKHAGDWDLLAAPEHRAIARDAVRKSLVLLKNENRLLPLRPDMHVLVTGDGANDIGKQSGGWTLSWQGTGNRKEHFPNGESIFQGLANALEAGGGRAVLSEDGSWLDRPDVAVVVFGEDPYAETQGDRRHVDFDPQDGLRLLSKFQEAGISTVAVFISGRPLWVNPELNASNAFVAAWLPGTEGSGIADVLVADTQGEPRFDFSGRLSYSWPASADQAEVNIGDGDYQPLFEYGYGLSYSDNAALAVLPEDSSLAANDGMSAGELITYGDPAGSWRMLMKASGETDYITDSRGESRTGLLTVVPADNEIQEDTCILTWKGQATMVIDGPRANFSPDIVGEQALELRYRVIGPVPSGVTLAVGEGSLDLSKQFAAQSDQGWQTALIPLSCFAEQGANLGAVTEPLKITADGALVLQIASARLTDDSGDTDCSLGIE